MDRTTLPTQRAAIQTAIDAARREGPPAIAQLAILCLWLAGHVNPPHDNYPGPSGAKPLEHLQFMLEPVARAKKGPKRSDFLTGRFSILDDYPKPKRPRRKTSAMSREVAQERVRRALQQAAEKVYPLPRHSLCSDAVLDLWQRGASISDLEPLLAEITSDRFLDGDEYGWYRARAIRTLAEIDEGERAVALAEGEPVSTLAGLDVRVKGARALIATDRADLAGALLDRMMAQRNRFPRDFLERLKPDVQPIPGNQADRVISDLAQVLAYLGRESGARALIQADPPGGRRFAEVLALSQYHRDGSADPAPLLAMLEGTLAFETPKFRAAQQTHILEVLLAIGTEDAARKALAHVQASLLAAPVWGKREHRTDGAVQVLLPYLDKHPAMIHDFAAGLLIGTALDVGDFWNIVFVVSSLRWLIWKWAGSEGVRQIIDFLSTWGTNPDLGR